MGFICRTGSDTSCSLDRPTGTSTTRGSSPETSEPPGGFGAVSDGTSLVPRRCSPVALSLGTSGRESRTWLGSGAASPSRSPTRRKGRPDMPSVSWGRAGRGLRTDLSGFGGVPNGAGLAPLPRDAERLPAGLEARDEARPLAEVDKAGETKVSVLGEEAGMAGVVMGTAAVAA